MKIETRTRKVVNLLEKHYPRSKTSLRYKKPLEILVATILSAQCTDARVNIVTKSLFKKYKNAKDYANANLKQLEKDIRSTGFYKNKAKNIKNASKLIIEKFNGKVPKTMKEILMVPGVARKTANIVLGCAYNIKSGIPIDTHNKRVLYRLRLTKNKDPNKIEQDMIKLIPKKYWLTFSYQIIQHGRALCKAPTPICSKCMLNKICPKIGISKRK